MKTRENWNCFLRSAPYIGDSMQTRGNFPSIGEPMQTHGNFKIHGLKFLFFALCPSYWRFHAGTLGNFNCFLCVLPLILAVPWSHIEIQFLQFRFLRSAPYIGDSMQTHGNLNCFLRSASYIGGSMQKRGRKTTIFDIFVFCALPLILAAPCRHVEKLQFLALILPIPCRHVEKPVFTSFVFCILPLILAIPCRHAEIIHALFFAFCPLYWRRHADRWTF